MTEVQLLWNILVELRMANLIALKNSEFRKELMPIYRKRAKEELNAELFEETMKEMAGE